MSTTTIEHPKIGKIKGSTAAKDVVQFKGLQYATIADRFAPAVMKEYDQTGTTDATRLGPQVRSIAPNADGEFRLIQASLAYDKSALSMSDSDGLCLNITTPPGDYSGKKFPVFVFIHGGGFNAGSAMYPQYDFAPLVRLGQQHGKPCIGVALNYRLGAPGLLTSAAMRAAGYKPNNTLRDQRTALLWIQEHISGFGGDAGNVTLLGESAGGVSVCYQLYSSQPLFKRFISFSGTPLLMPAATADESEAQYQLAVKALGISDKSAEEQLRVLTTVDGGEMVGKLMAAGARVFTPMLDEDICPSTVSFEAFQKSENSLFPSLKWCEAGIIGDCQFDGNIRGLDIAARKAGIAGAFMDIFSSDLGKDTAERLFEAYGITRGLDDDEAFRRVLYVANDLNFYVPSLITKAHVARTCPGVKTFAYRFNEPNPWEGQWKGEATHILDITFLFQHYNDQLAPEQRKTAEAMAADFLSFVYGEDPWQASKAKVYGPQGQTEIVDDEPEKTGRRRLMLDFGEQIGLDKLAKALANFFRPPPPA